MNPSPFLLALDQGTSSSLSIGFDADGQIVAMAERWFRQDYPQPGRLMAGRAHFPSQNVARTGR